ncbi:MAG TPA: hypothetical protein VM123_04820 [archaeon]|nr:hypothetical protein [archaeon]
MKNLILTLLVLTFSCSPGENPGSAGESQPTAGKQEALVVWEHPYMLRMHQGATAPKNVSKILGLSTTPGEYEPAAFAMRSDSSAWATVNFVPDTTATALPEEWYQLHEVRSRFSFKKPNRLFEFSNPVQLEADQTRFFWLTIHPPDDAPAGVYKSRLLVETARDTQSLEVICRVLPFRLDPCPITGGVFMSSTDLPAKWYRDMKEHGLDAIQFFWNGAGIRVERRRKSGGKDALALDFSGLDKLMNKVCAAGLKGPVVLTLGNEFHLHFERRIAEKFGIPVETKQVSGWKLTAPEVSPALDSLFVEGLRQIRHYWESKAWPQELVMFIYDEPTKRLLKRHKHRYDLLKTVMPDYRVYGVVMNRRDWAESMADQCDIIVSDGDFPGCRDVAKKFGKDFWVYTFPLDGLMTSRYNMGCLPWKHQAQTAFFWMYNYWNYAPDGCAVYRHPDDPEKLVRSTAWEVIREGRDDLRYIATAERIIAQAPEEVQLKAAKRLTKAQKSPDQQRVREAAIEIILSLQQSGAELVVAEITTQEKL